MMLDIFDKNGKCIGQASRRECHGNPALLHRTAHVVVIHPDSGDILLQKRSMTKDIQPGKWDTAVGGHLEVGESFEAGALRELAEELGVAGDVVLNYFFDDQIRNEIESEDVRVFGTELSGPFDFQRSEIDEVRFWSWEEIDQADQQQLFTPNVIKELQKLREFLNL